MELEPRLTYVGDCARDLLWRILGPDTAGGYIRVTRAIYDPELNVTRASVEPVAIEWITEHLTRDEWRQLYLKPEFDDSVAADA